MKGEYNEDFKTIALNDISNLCNKWKEIQKDYILTDEEMEIAQFIIGKTQNMEFAIRLGIIDEFED